MRFKRHNLVIGLFIGVAASILAATSAHTAHAFSFPDPIPVTITGTVTEHGKPAPGLNVVAWCGDSENFGGWDETDADGKYKIQNDGERCPLKMRGYIIVYRPNPNNWPETVAFQDIITHRTMVVNIRVGEDSPVAVPEFGWTGGAATAAVSLGTIAWVRHRVRS